MCNHIWKHGHMSMKKSMLEMFNLFNILNQFDNEITASPSATVENATCIAIPFEEHYGHAYAIELH